MMAVRYFLTNALEAGVPLFKLNHVLSYQRLSGVVWNFQSMAEGDHLEYALSNEIGLGGFYPLAPWIVLLIPSSPSHATQPATSFPEDNRSVLE